MSSVEKAYMIAMPRVVVFVVINESKYEFDGQRLYFELSGFELYPSF